MVSSNFELNGGIVFWSLSQWTHRENLRASLAVLGLEDITPPNRQPIACLKDALEQTLGGPRVLVRPLSKRDGFSVVMEDRKEDENVYTQTLTAKVVKVGQDGFPILDFNPLDDRAKGVKEVFVNQLGLIHAYQMSNCLVAAMDKMNGTRLRPMGGLYWLPGSKIEEWEKIAQAVENASVNGGNKVYLIRHQMDEQALRAVQDGLIGEITSSIEQIEKDIFSGELKGRAIHTRQEEANALREKVFLYEGILARSLEQLHEALDKTDQAAAAALLIASANAGKQQEELSYA